MSDGNRRPATGDRRLFLTTAIDYVNSTPHIGTAYEKIGADVIARFARLQGRKVWLQMGNDEHSTNVRKAAVAKGIDPHHYCTEMERAFTNVWQRLDIAYDGFIRTTHPDHAKAVTALFNAIFKGKTPRGAPNIYKKPYGGWYCESCEAYYTEKDLVENLCPTHKLPTRWIEEENYFFALSHYQEWLAAHLKKHPEFILPAVRRNEITRLIESGLEDISISRASQGWGIPVPIDPSQTVYVWFDALINYITAAGYGTNPKRFATWWKGAEVAHIIGKDITRFHCVIWPAMLKAAGIPLPRTIFGHGFVYQRGEKMSKTLGNVVAPLDLVDRFGADPVRYFLLRENSFGRDADFTWERFIERYNSDLANGIGNLVSRTVGMIHRYCDGVVKPVTKAPKGIAPFAGFAAQRQTLVKTLTQAFTLSAAHDDIAFHDALAAIWQLMTAADLYINDTAPWTLQKQGQTDAVAYVLYQVTEAIRVQAIALQPFMPGTAAKIWAQMGLESVTPLHKIRWQHLVKFTPLKKSLRIAAAQPLFPRIEMEKEITMEPTSPSPQPSPSATQPADTQKGEGVHLIDISDFAKIDLRIVTITAAEKVEGADKLLKLQVDCGAEQRQIVAGIAKHYPPEELIGRQVVIVANLKPVKLRGVESQGMLLAGSLDDQLSIVTPQRPLPNGARVK